MRILNVCETPLLATEVYNLIRGNANNHLAFADQDPLENPDISDSDELRRLVASRRIVHYLESCLSGSRFRTELVGPVLKVLSTFNLSKETIVVLMDNLVLTGSVEGSNIYLRLVLGDDPQFSHLTDVQLESIRKLLLVLAGEEEATLEEIEELASIPEEPPTKRRSSSRK